MNKKTLTAMNILFVLSFVAGAVCVAYRRNWLLFGNVVFGLVLIESLYLFVWRKTELSAGRTRAVIICYAVMLLAMLLIAGSKSL
ncbi:MAG: hypothetical protein K6G18_03955 [Treponema sp.]|nr:hypothetical protein [Treponema sp.]